MPLMIKQLSVSGDRASIRKQVIVAFLDENPGTGCGEDCSKYIYEVELLASGNKVFLKRPAALNKGVDFEVHVQGIMFRPARLVTMPSHKNIFQDLSAKQKENPLEYERVKNILNRLYTCQDVSEADYRSLNFTSGHSIETVLKAIKWLFIEQDVTYWNWSGRYMLYSGLKERDLC